VIKARISAPLPAPISARIPARSVRRGVILKAALLIVLLASLFIEPTRAQDVPQEPELTPGAFLRYSGGIPLDRPPYPDAWIENPLEFSYAPAESVFLPPPPPEVTTQKSNPRMGLFAPPGKIGRSVRILVQAQARSLLVNTRRGADLQWRGPGGRAQRGSSLSGAVRVERKNGKFSVAPIGGASISGGDAVALRIAPLDPSVPLELNGKTYRGSLEFHPEGSGFICINVLPLEEYLRGVVPLEMGRHDETRIEALKAQAVAARTYSVKRVLARTGEAFDLYSSVQDQVYGGAAAEHPMSDRAIRETAGILLLHQDSLAHTYYHSTCGGTTASRHEMWGGAPIPYLISAPDTDSEGNAWCRASRYMAWTQEWDLDQLTTIVRKNLPEAGVRGAQSFKSITAIEPRSRYSDGRINMMEIRTDRGTILVRGDKTRWALRPAPGTGRILESARFDIEIRSGRAVAKGNGFGHGIGMCQMGALGRAQAGQTYAEILQAYYPGTDLAKLEK
jgi:stage II sporulation protein D